MQVLGEGTFAEVKLLVNAATGEACAMKEINLAPAEDPEAAAAVAEAVKKEICVHKLLDHENVVRCYGSRMERTRQFIFLEYCSGGELFDRIGEQESLEPDIHFDRPPAILSPHCGGCYAKNPVLRAKCQLSFNCQTFSPSTFSLASRAAYLPKKSLFQARDFSLLIFLLPPSPSRRAQIDLARRDTRQEEAFSTQYFGFSSPAERIPLFPPSSSLLICI